MIVIVGLDLAGTINMVISTDECISHSTMSTRESNEVSGYIADDGPIVTLSYLACARGSSDQDISLTSLFVFPTHHCPLNFR